MACEIHVDDVGTIFELAIVGCDALPVNITNATSLKIIIVKPDQTKLTKTAVMFGAGTSGVIRYTTITGDLDQIGKYKLQAEVTLPAGKWYSDIQSFSVKGNL